MADTSRLQAEIKALKSALDKLSQKLEREVMKVLPTHVKGIEGNFAQITALEKKVSSLEGTMADQKREIASLKAALNKRA